MTLTLDYKPSFEECEHCDTLYLGTGGRIYDDGTLCAFYRAHVHACEKRGPVSVIVRLSVVLNQTEAAREAVLIQVWSVGDQYQMSVLEPSLSPWRADENLDVMRTPAEVLASPRKGHFFDLATCVVRRNEMVVAFLGGVER